MESVSLRAHPHERECSVCYVLFTKPKLLPCGHLLCRHCLVSWMEIQEEALCPLCRCAIIEGEQPGLQSMEDIADGFPTDLAMEELVEAQRLLNKGHYCCVCEDVAAVSVCLNCRDMLCKACKKAHGKLSMSKDHIVEDLSSLTAEKLAANSPSTCADHSEEMPRLYCCTHGASICLLCASSKHRNCPEVMDLEEKAEEARAKLAELTASLSAGETELERSISQLDQHLQDTEERTQAAIVEMEETCYRLESAVKACRHQWRELALSTCSDVKESVHAEKNCLLKRRRKLTSHKHVAQRVEGMKTGHVVSTMTSVMETRVTELDCSAPLPAIAEVVSTVTMIIDPQVVSTIERGLAALGKVKGVPFEIVADMKKVVYSFV